MSYRDGMIDRLLAWASAARVPSSGVVLLPLRLFLGGTFVFAGLQKLADPVFFAGADVARSMAFDTARARDSSPVGFLLGPVEQFSTAFAWATALAEVLIGVAVLLGVATRLAALAGLLLSLGLFLTVSFSTWPYYYGSDIVFTFAWTPLVLAGAGVGVWSWDERRRAVSAPADPPSGVPAAAVPERRAFLAGALTVLGLTAAASVVTTALGRALGRNADAAAGGPAGPDPTGAPVTAAPGGGTAVLALADLPVGGVADFTDPATGAAAFAVRPADGTVLAYARACPHQGCPVELPPAADDTIECRCHNSAFDPADGAVLAGPATRPLQRIPVAVEGDSVVTA